jgi:hypothetical protein
MKKVLMGLMVAGLVAGLGCNQSTGGRPATGAHGGGITGGKEKFTLKGPVTTTTLMQGETRKDELTVSKGAEFKDDITFSVKSKPEGVDATVEPKTLKGSEGSGKVEVTLKAADNAKTGEGTVVVEGKPHEGEPADIPIKVKVEPKAAKQGK